MKSFLFVCGIILMGLKAEAARVYQYETDYYTWNRSFTSYSSYRETSCAINSNGYSTTETCYSIERNQKVYISESVVESRRQVTVYSDSYRTRSIARYYMVDNVVYERYYYPHGVIVSHHYVYRPSTIVWVDIDFSTVEGKIITGAYMAGVGAVVMADSCGRGGRGNDAACALGAASASLGLLSSSMAVEQAERESQLMKELRKNVTQNSGKL